MKKPVYINLLSALLDRQLAALISYCKTKISLLLYFPHFLKRVEFHCIEFCYGGLWSGPVFRGGFFSEENDLHKEEAS